MTSSPIPLGEVLAGKYRIDRVLGEGGMGVVVLAHHLELDQPVAIKFLLDAMATNDEGAERFRREARAAAKIQSDHVVRVLDVGVLEGGERYMVMEYMRGRDLGEELAEKHTLPVGFAASVVLQAIDAVGHAHAVGIVHRDLKPGNLFLADRADGSQRVKVLDFGISKSVGSATGEELSLTKTSAWIGSPLYMAPEQMQSARDVDYRADIWSLGAILYEMIAGRPPYQAESLPQLCNLLITTDPEPIEALVPSIPPGLAQAIMKCLVRDRDARTQSTSELGRVLVNYATSTTGSSITGSMMDRTEYQTANAGPGESFSGVAPVVGSPATEGAKMSDSTKAAWGGADSGSSGPKGNKLGWVVAALVGAAVVGFFALRGNTDSADVESESPVVGTQAEAAADADADADSGEVEPDSKEPEPADPDPKQEKPVEPQPAPAPDPKPRPAPKPDPRPPVSAPRPAPSPRPSPAPKADPKESDDFADFGGRR